MDNSKALNPQLITFLSNIPELTPEKVEMLAAMIPVKSTKKGDIILKEGETPKECYYVLQGLVRQYQFIDGTERTTEFYDELNGSISSDHYTNQTPSTFYLACEEDCLLIAGNMQIDEVNFKQFPELMEITRRMMESELNSTKQTLTQFILSPPKDRYLHLLKTRPTLLNRVPLHQIASYLGITAESLSRIRKRITSPEG
jgi:CRP-like cAMP-binding protein